MSDVAYAHCPNIECTYTEEFDPFVGHPDFCTECGTALQNGCKYCKQARLKLEANNCFRCSKPYKDSL